MSKISFAEAEQAGTSTRRKVFFSEMELAVSWKTLLNVIEPRYSNGILA